MSQTARQMAAGDEISHSVLQIQAGVAEASVADRVAAHVLKQIAGGELAAGSRLPSERKLAETLGVSRVSVRAALQKLKAQGFLNSVQGGGTKVVSGSGCADPALAELTRLDRSNLVDLMELREALEVWACRRAALMATDESVSALKANLAAMADRNSDKARLDVEFHLMIADMTGSVVYRHLLIPIRATLTEMLHYHRTQLFADADDDAAILSQHHTIVEAIASRDETRAAAAMTSHLTWVRRHYDEAVKPE